MSDERWLSKDERIKSWDAPKGTWQRMLCDHAEAADELIAELAEALHRAGADLQFLARGNSQRPSFDAEVAAGRCVALLARVDALTKDTA